MVAAVKATRELPLNFDECIEFLAARRYVGREPKNQIKVEIADSFPSGIAGDQLIPEA
jgi:hypothetical protein